MAIRKRYSQILRNYFYHQLIQTRERLGATQAEMAERLAMDARSYIELDHGNSCCSGLTLALFLAFCCDDLTDFVVGLRQAFEQGAGYAA